MGMKVDLTSFVDFEVLILALTLTIAAIIGKQVCGLAVLGKGMNRLSVGIGMIPRGEVGLIFASIGTQLVLNGTPLIDKSLYSAIVVMVMLTTLLTPPLLKWSMSR